MERFDELTGLYSLSKTLQFELKPIGKTLEQIERKGIIAQDEKRAEEYEIAKCIIDEYHKAFISMCLKGLRLNLSSTGSLDSLEEYVEQASKLRRSESEEKNFDTIKQNLRRQIVNSFKSRGGSFTDLFKKELITQHLPEFVSEKNKKQIVENFSKFTTYFTGFHENRKNLYSEEEKSTAIAYRLIHENLPMFIDNIKTFAKIADSDVANYFVEIETTFSEYLDGSHITDMFKLEYFTETLTQEQISLYNNVIGGVSNEDGTKKKGLNEYVNLYNQQNKTRLPLLKPLYKMLLSDKVSLSWLPDDFVSDEEMIYAINEMQLSLKDLLYSDGENSLKYLLTHIGDYDTEHIYISNDLGLTDISQQIFGQYDVYTSGIKTELCNQIKQSAKEKREPELYKERINKLFKSAKSFSINYLNSFAEGDKTIQAYYARLGAHDLEGEQSTNLFTQIEMASIAASDILAGKHTNINQSEEDTKLIKDLLDTYKALQHFIKPLLGNGDEADKDNEFDARLRNAWDALSVVTPLYNKVRNWLTRKPYSTEKIKLNFDNAQLLGGWDLNKEPDCTSVLLRKDDMFYLAIMDKKYNHAFDIDELPCEGECYEKVDYKLLPGANKMLPKVFFSKSRISEFAPSLAIQKSYNEGTHKKGSNFSISDCHRLIDFFKQSIAKHEDWSKFPFSFSDTKRYEDISGFYREVEQQGYMLSYRNVSVSFINQLVDEGKLYLFQIWNKDFSKYSKGTPNMHTLYWKMLFDEVNLADTVYKLNGQAEVFYRKSSLKLENTTIHKANQTIKNKNVQNEKKTSTFDYDIVKNRRYTVDKFQFHVPITLNFKATGGDNINANVQDIIRNNGIEHIIGIDRGERHLLYLSLIDLKGNIVKQMTLNDIINEYKGNIYKTNYKDLLVTREGDRTEARRNWHKIENIKDLKEGYLSQVVHIIARMMAEYKAIVVLEDLNMGFMRGRQKIERNVYEQFERMLIDKLNYYVDKQKKATENGGLLHALQLANKFESFKKLGKQSGCLFYIPAWNTSKIDPVTGFVNLFEIHYENVDKARCFFSKFDIIQYNEERDWFEFAFDYNDFGTKAEGTKSKWTLCTYGTRIKTFRNPNKLNQWDNEEVVLTEEFKKIFNEAGIDINGNIKDAICQLKEKKHLESLMHLMKLLLQMRNSVSNSEIDYLLSPVADENGEFYDSRTCAPTLPKDADANGAYNIARKGLWVIEQIKQTADKPRLAMTNKEWLKFAQDKPYLNE
ncbi:MAG: type V CRISPR-associated protein Cpf1 [Bacteroidales bacterium]|jgi:CRISPR-associated protein Cpf1|nr:type V CRISPR-associated protein Cpf1 [Bacteroidales bacterium]